MRHLQQLSTKYRDQVAVVGINTADDRKIAQEFLDENEATFPTVLDPSEAGLKMAFQDYRVSGVPVHYILDTEGRVVDTWYGYEEGHARAKAALKKAGLVLPE